MNQNDFFNILMDGLKDFPEIKLQDIISYYENKFAIELASGKTEEEIITELGNPNLIVDKYRNETLETPTISEYLPNDADITPISKKSSINDLNSVNNNNFINNDSIFTKDQNIVTDNNDIFSDFNTNDNLSNDNNFEANNNSFKTSTPYEGINSNDTFNDIDTSNICAASIENNYKSSGSNKSNYILNDQRDFDSNNNNKNNSNFNNDKNSNYSFNNKNSKNKIPQFNVNTILKICIVILALIIFFPVITGIIGCILGLLGVAISILVGSIGLLIGGTFTNFIGLPNMPMFVANFPYPVIVLFSLGSILLSIFLTLLFYYLCKFFIHISIKAYKSLKSKGGAF